MAKTLIITREHLDKDNYYIGPEVTNYDGDIVLEANLGVVKFKNDVSVPGSILAKSGTNIKSSKSIKAGRSIKSSASIEAGYSIQAGYGIEARESIKAGAYIKAGESIEAGWCIEAGDSIEADGSIEAGASIKAGKGIRAGLSIKCKTLTAEFPIFAGTATWVRPSKEETQIRCEKLFGTVAYGELILKGEEVAK